MPAVQLHGCNDGGVHRYTAFVSALAGDRDEGVVDIDIAVAQGRALGGADAGAVQQCQQGAVAQADECVIRWRAEKLLDLLRRKFELLVKL